MGACFHTTAIDCDNCRFVLTRASRPSFTPYQTVPHAEVRKGLSDEEIAKIAQATAEIVLAKLSKMLPKRRTRAKHD